MKKLIRKFKTFNHKRKMKPIETGEAMFAMLENVLG